MAEETTYETGASPTETAVRAAREAESQPSGEQTESKRPDWLNPKFSSPEEMAKAYNELEQKLGAKPKAPDLDQVGKDQPDTRQEAPQANESPAGQSFLPGVENNTVEEISNYAWEHRELSEEHYAKLAEAGYDKQLVDEYMAGQFARADAAEAQLLEVGGGSENVEAMFNWAQHNMTQEQIDSYNEMFDRGGGEAMMAMENLRAKFENSGQAMGTYGVRGAVSAPSYETSTFEDSAQVIEAMNDPRYASSEAYRQEVQRKLARSNVIATRGQAGPRRGRWQA